MPTKIVSQVIAVNSISASQLKEDLTAILHDKESQNIAIENDKLIILDGDAIDVKTSSKAYKYLLEVAKSFKTYYYTAVLPGHSAL